MWFKKNKGNKKNIIDDNFSEIINDDDYKCKYERKELNRKLNNFINQQNIQDLAREQNDNSDDSVYELIKKDENEELTKFFDKIKLNFMIDIDNHLTSEYRLMNNNYYQLVTQIISHENGNEKYKKK